MSNLEDLLALLYKYLTRKDVSNSNIIRRHTRELERSGDLSFPLDASNWYAQIDPKELTNGVKTIFEYASRELSTDSLLEASKTWPLRISKCFVHGDNVQIYLEHTHAFRHVIEAVHLEKDSYGQSILGLPNEILIVESDCERHEYNNMNLSELRATLLKNAAVNLLHLCNINVVDSERRAHNAKVRFAVKAVEGGGAIILCGAVLNERGLKNTDTTAEQFLQKRTVDMRLIAEHKYGLRVTSQPGWREFFDKLGEAAVIIELLQNKPSHNTKIHMNNAVTSNKGASFILYNCARLATLFKEFNRKVSSGIYPDLPAIKDTDFTLLVQPEEWELLYVYILQFPLTIKTCIKDILDCRFNPHQLVSMLSGLAQAFSVYYRRVKILTEPRQHLFALLHARIHLLKALERVMHNGLRLLNIQPVRQM